MSFRQELMKHLDALPVTEVKKLVSKYNKELDIRPISKLKKAEVLQKIADKKPMDKQLLTKLTNDARARVEGKKAQKASEKEAAKKPVEKFGTEKKKIKVKKAKPDFLDLDKDGNKKEPMKKAAKDADKPKKKIIKVKKSKNEPLSKENREIKSELRKIMNKHFAEVIKVYKKVLSGKIKNESREEEELLKEAEEDTNEELATVAIKYKIPKSADSEFFKSDRGFTKTTRLQSLINSKIGLTTLSNYKEVTKLNKKLDEKFN